MIGYRNASKLRSIDFILASGRMAKGNISRTTLGPIVLRCSQYLLSN